MSLRNSLCLSAALLTGYALSAVAQPLLSPPVIAAGDRVAIPSVEDQEWPQIAAGDGTYLVVWQDTRTVLSGTTNAPSSPLAGNGWDIYGALLDSEGQMLKGPIVISQRGRNDTRPRVAWNGTAWLVVWTSERPNWYFFEDIVGARVSAQGEVIDREPIVIRPENNDPANDLAQNPWVASDGKDWVVVWQANTYDGFLAYPNLTGRRVAADGTFPEPERLLYQFDGNVFGPEDPQIVWASDRYLLAWEDFGDLQYQRFDATLHPVDPDPIHIANSRTNPRVATNGTDFLLVTAEYRAYRIRADGNLLDPASGIDFDLGGDVFQPDGPNVAWDGTHWAITFGSGEGFGDSDVYLLRLDTGGNPVPPGAVLVQRTTENDWQPDVASQGDGAVQIAWVEAFPEDVVGTRVDADASIAPPTELSVGWSRQSALRYATNGDEHLAVYRAEGDGLAQILAQRIHASGGAIDAEPILVTEYDEGSFLQFDVAFDGTYYLVAWTDSSGFVWGIRLDTDGVPVDNFPRIFVSTDAAGEIATAALDGTFLVTYTHTFSGDQRNLKAVQVRASDGIVLGAPFTIGFNFAKEPRAVVLGGRWFVVWEDQTNHDQSTSSTRGVFVETSGNAGATFAIDQSGFGDDPDVAVLDTPDRGEVALVVWYDDANFGDSFVEGRLVAPDGSFLTAEFLIAEAPNDQFFTRVGTDGEQFVAAWVDYRDLGDVDALRGDVWAARIGTDGEVIDLGGFQVSSGELPEDLPDVVGSSGRALVGFSGLAGLHTREVQRITHRVLGQAMSLEVEGTCPGELTIELKGATPFADITWIRAPEHGTDPVPAGTCAGIPLDLENPTRVSTQRADSDGRISLTLSVGPGVCGAILQALDLSDCSTSAATGIPAS